MAHLDELEESIEMLKVKFERYFNGVDRVPPTRDHDDVKRAVRTLLTIRGGPTAVRFRLQNLKARLVTYEQYWTRILFQIEKGTFKRIVAESARRQQLIERRQVPTPLDDAPTTEFLVPGATAGPKPAPKPTERATGPALPADVEASEVRELFRQFVAAKKAAGEPTAGITYGKLVDKLTRELPQLREKHGADVRFEVATIDGKVRLRARSRAERGQKAS